MNIKLTDLPGVGVKTTEKLKKLGICTMEDLLSHYPYRYDDRSRIVPVKELVNNQKNLIRVQMDTSTLSKKHAKGKRMIEIKCFDATGELKVIWFNQQYIYDKISRLDAALLFGTVKEFNGRKYLVNPEIIDKNQDI